MSLCPLCKSKLKAGPAAPPRGIIGIFYNCPQCGKFTIDSDIEDTESSDYKHEIAGYLLEINNVKVRQSFPVINHRKLHELLNSGFLPKDAVEKMIRLLKYIQRETEFYGEQVEIPLAAAYAKKDGELFNILSYLNDGNLIICNLDDSEDYQAAITIEGIKFLNQNQQQTTKTDQCFIAMWFDQQMEEARVSGLIPGVESAGYKPCIVNTEPFNGDIVDKILAMIRESYFVVADLTGNRGGVYFEAGFAKGLGKEVIFTCKETWFDKTRVHFDTEHMNLIIWDDPVDLRDKLQYRIEATLGKNQVI